MAEQRRDSRTSKPSSDRRGGAKKATGSKPPSSRGGSSAAGRGESRGTGKPAAKKTAAKRPSSGARSEDGPKKYAAKKDAPARGAAPRGAGAKKTTGSRSYGDAPAGKRAAGSRSYGDAPSAKKTTGSRSYGDAPAGKRAAGSRSYGDAPAGKRAGGSRPQGAGRAPARSERFERTARPEQRTDDQTAYDGPDLPEHITGKELDRGITAQLKGLPEKLAARVARHLAAAGYYIDDNPELAYQHAKAAKSRSQRIAVVREALGEAAYAAGHYAEALAELRAAKRMNGATAYLPIMADCHRALGHPQDAIKLAHSPSVVNFAPEAKAEMTLVEAGARRDMGQLDAALRILEQAPLMHKSRSAWVVRLRYAYADTLEAAGRRTEALEWFNRTAGADGEEITDALARAEALSDSIIE